MQPSSENPTVSAPRRRVNVVAIVFGLSTLFFMATTALMTLVALSEPDPAERELTCAMVFDNDVDRTACEICGWAGDAHEFVSCAENTGD